MKRLWLLASTVLWLCSCTSPAERVDAAATRLALERGTIDGSGFTHVFYRNGAPVGSNGVLHVYLGGDGSPWLNRYTVAPDPTPRRPLTLALMSQDPEASLYLGRPCYHGQATAPECHAELWTTRRYGPEIVDSLEAALRRYLRGQAPLRIVFIGYSGGGALAMLLAERFVETAATVTVAGNLDTDSWARYHGFSPLTGSLNPASRPPLAPNITQRHFRGTADRTVPPSLPAPTAKGGRILVQGFDHVCCWVEAWPRLLESLPKG